MMTSLLRASDLLGFRGTVVPEVWDAGRTFAAVVQPDWEEVARRNSAGEGPLLDRSALRALFELPEAEWVPWSALDPIVAATLDAIPGAPISSRGALVKRVWRPALHVSGVLIRENRWSNGLRRAAEFWVDARRAYIVPANDVPPRAVREAREHGVGMVLDRPGGSAALLLPPSRRIHGRGSPRHWRFREAVFQAWREMPPPREAHAFK